MYTDQRKLGLIKIAIDLWKLKKADKKPNIDWKIGGKSCSSITQITDEHVVVFSDICIPICVT